MPPAAPTACIAVIAGVNGAGKSSVVGATVRAKGGLYFNPDEATREALAASPGMTREMANSWAWELGRRQLEQSIAERRDFTFETTLGGNTITGLLRRACDAGLAVRMQYVGLASPEQHIARVRARVARGGHNISDARIRARYDTSRQHCIDLLPHLTELRLYDNSAESAPDGPTPPVLRLLLHVERGRIVTVGPPPTMPEWAKPIVVAAENLAR